MNPETRTAKHIRLTSHPAEGAWGALPIRWGRADPKERGPVVGSTANRSQRNVIGTHSGSYGVYRALAVAAGALMRGHRPDLTNTAPTDPIGPYPQWGDAGKIVSLDPFGAIVADVFRDEIAAGYDIRPTIAVTKAHIDMPEVHAAMAAGRLAPDGRILLANGSAVVTKAAIEPVWWLPGVAKRFGVDEGDLRRVLFEIPPGRPEKSRDTVDDTEPVADPKKKPAPGAKPGTVVKAKPLPARRATDRHDRRDRAHCAGRTMPWARRTGGAAPGRARKG